VLSANRSHADERLKIVVKAHDNTSPTAVQAVTVDCLKRGWICAKFKSYEKRHFELYLVMQHHIHKRKRGFVVDRRIISVTGQAR
jgi:hypothetical protein